MDKQNKGLADNNDGDLILNESGTSVNIGLNEEGKPDAQTSSIDDPVAENDIDSDRNSKAGVGEIKAFNDVYPNHQALEDVDEIQSTDDV